LTAAEADRLGCPIRHAGYRPRDSMIEPDSPVEFEIATNERLQATNVRLI
jgi:hypothetical protein